MIGGGNQFKGVSQDKLLLQQKPNIDNLKKELQAKNEKNNVNANANRPRVAVGQS